MKILVAKFQLEANAFVPMKCDMENVAISYGIEALTHMQLGNVFEKENIDLIPVICADAACSGVMKLECFQYIEQKILNAVSSNKKDLDGIYLHLHGASEIEELGSGEHHLVHEIRKIVGPYFPIFVSCDPHGNLSKTYVEETTMIRSYRESPHTDIAQTVQRVCNSLIDFIKHPQNITPIYRKLQMILGGEQSVSTDEPVKSINAYMNELEKDPRILSCSWHVGYLRHDTHVAGCGIVVVPATAKDQGYAEKIADELAEYVWKKRHEFHYTGRSLDMEQAIEMSLSFDQKPVFLSDSGDNVTSGAMGANTFLLKRVLEIKDLKKKFAFIAIQDPKTYSQLMKKEIGEEVSISLGMNFDCYTKPVPITVKIKYKGRQEGTYMYGEDGDYGGLVTVEVVDQPITIVITENNHSFVEEHQIIACGIDWKDYDIIVVKQGYLHPELIQIGKLNIMVLTEGATLQDTKKIPFKLIMRPMYPIDNI